MKKIIQLLLFSLLAIPAFAQTEKVKVKGIVLNIESLEPIQYPSIETVKGHKRYIGNKSGVFYIEAAVNDSVYVSAIGYTRVKIEVKQIMPLQPDDSVLILLKPVTYQLRDVTVLRSTTRQDSLARRVAHILATDSLMNNFDRIYDRTRGKIYVGSGVIYEGVIQDLYNKFSKEGQDNVHFEEFVQYSLHLRKVDQRYNKQVVKQVTGLEEPELDEFMIFCKPDKNFIVNASDYDLLLAIKKCGDDFQLRKK